MYIFLKNKAILSNHLVNIKVKRIYDDNSFSDNKEGKEVYKYSKDKEIEKEMETLFPVSKFKIDFYFLESFILLL
jgi:hypothetical protein